MTNILNGIKKVKNYRLEKFQRENLLSPEVNKEIIDITDPDKVFENLYKQAEQKILNRYSAMDIEWSSISEDIKQRIYIEHSNLYNQITKRQEKVDKAWQDKDLEKFKIAVEQWDHLWNIESQIWKSVLVCQ